jgi:leucyl aminopeptidase (aminopeptidase T)
METNNLILPGAKRILLECMAAKPVEKTLIVCDEKTSEIAYSFAAAGREAGLDVVFLEAPSQTKGDVSPLVAKAMLEADVELLITSMSYSHTSARSAATKSGARIATMPMLTREIAENYLEADYSEIAKRSATLATLFDHSSEARLLSRYGTDLTLGFRGRKAMADTGILRTPGAFGNLPAGEGLVAPLEDQANGVFVLRPGDCIAYVGRVEDTVEISIENGRIKSIEGGSTAHAFRDFLHDKDDESDGIAELGVGTNPVARLIGHPLLDEKVMGTAHIAFGNSAYFGGERVSDIHVDCIAGDITLYLDDRCVIEDGVHIYSY